MPRAVHRLDREHALVASLGDEHALAEILPMPRGFPYASVEQLRGFDLLVTSGVEPIAQVILDDTKQRPPLGMPEDATDRLFLEVKQLEFAPEPAMVAPL